MKRLTFLFLLLSSICLAQSNIEMHEWGNNSGRWWTHRDTTYYKSGNDTTMIGGGAFYTWPYTSLFLSVDDTVTSDANDSTAFSVYMFQSPDNDLTTAVFVDSLTFRGVSTKTYTTISAAGRYGLGLEFRYLPCRYTWFCIRELAGNRVIKYNRCISTWTGFSPTASTIYGGQ